MLFSTTLLDAGRRKPSWRSYTRTLVDSNPADDCKTPEPTEGLSALRWIQTKPTEAAKAVGKHGDFRESHLSTAAETA